MVVERMIELRGDVRYLVENWEEGVGEVDAEDENNVDEESDRENDEEVDREVVGVGFGLWVRAGEVF
jgi:hypothetical protein